MVIGIIGESCTGKSFLADQLKDVFHAQVYTGKDYLRLAGNEAIAQKLKGLTVRIVAKAGSGGRLFGAVTSKEISDALKAQHGIEIAKAKIVQEEPIKSFGGYELKCKLGYEITGTLKVVVSEE